MGMKVAMICEKCGKVHTEDTDGAYLLIDFKKKQFSFICQDKGCKHDNMFDFVTWKKHQETSPLPKMKLM